MNDLEYNPFSKKEYYDMCGVNTEEKLHFYYDESNNCRKFWLVQLRIVLITIFWKILFWLELLVKVTLKFLLMS